MRPVSCEEMRVDRHDKRSGRISSGQQDLGGARRLPRAHAREATARHEAALAGLKDATRDRFLLAVGPDTGRLINILARSLTAPHILELGTSYGYSTLWLAKAACAAGGRVTT